MDKDYKLKWSSQLWSGLAVTNKVQKKFWGFRFQLANWYRLVSVNWWSIDSHIDFHRLVILIGYWLLFPWKLITESCLKSIARSSISNINRLIVIDRYWLESILIDWQIHRLHMPGMMTLFTKFNVHIFLDWVSFKLYKFIPTKTD